jgi:signal transduction histidine kinase
MDQDLSVDDFMTIDFKGSTPRALLNKHLLQRALYNLGINAIKYGRPGGYLRIRVDEVQVNEDAAIAIEFEDSGVGIPEEDLEQIFTTGYRGSNVREEISGEGLGLSIARSIVLAHRGSISVESPRSPTLFRMILPLRRPPRGREDAYQGGQLRRFDPPRPKSERKRRRQS